ncbi:MAG: crossover junction endodeoxyribonuclease RuvC [Planctomycetota bacterium]|nr:crossover junction endodeoxyribonuclease RuvC [Planctomycetota bacterium]
MSDSRTIRILGIDPGLSKMGWGIVDVDGHDLSLVEFGSLKTSTDLPHSQRLLEIHQEIKRAISMHSPDIAAVEDVFYGKNARSALLAGEGRAVCILACSLVQLSVVELSASAVKQGVTGSGRASKQQVQAMVQRILGLDEAPRPADAADALAVAIVMAQRNRSRLVFSQDGTGGDSSGPRLDSRPE